MALKLLPILVALTAALSSGIGIETLSEGMAPRTPSIEAPMVLKTQHELDTIWKGLGIEGPGPTPDFEKELVFVLHPSSKPSSGINFMGVLEKKDELEIKYFLRPPSTGKEAKAGNQPGFPYSIAKLKNTYPKDIKIKFTEATPQIPAGNAFTQLPSYSGILSAQSTHDFSAYFPLDKGNSWTYLKESGDGATSVETYSISSTSQEGWSTFDNFFGKDNIAFKTDANGDLLVLSNGRQSPFYPDRVKKNFSKESFATPAGEFNDLLYVTIDDNGNFWFKDVYARGVGLIYHEHKSPKGNAKFRLMNAEIRGHKYPAK